MNARRPIMARKLGRLSCFAKTMVFPSLALMFICMVCLWTSAVSDPIRGSLKRSADDFIMRSQRNRQQMEKQQMDVAATPAPTSDPMLWPTPTVAPITDPGPDPSDGNITYAPGDFSDNKASDDGTLRLSNGLSCERIATSGEYVVLANGLVSEERFHDQPDGAAVFPKADGGWYYVSNAENNSTGITWEDGGVGALEFNSNGEVIGYNRIGSHLLRPCSGGKTPWNSWIACEEIKIPALNYSGRVWQVDPSGLRPKEVTSMGDLGWYESFAYDDSTSVPTFYVTRDNEQGVLTRFTPNGEGMACYDKSNEYDRWCTLNHGTIDYLLITGGETGSFTWTTNMTAAGNNAKQYYQNAEGVDSADGKIFFVSKTLKRLVILDLHLHTYTYGSTETGAFSHQPDQVARIVRDDESILYFCEDGGPTSGIYGRTASGAFFTVLEGREEMLPAKDETTGLSFTTNGMHMYVTHQEGGYVYDCTRDDGMQFYGDVIDIKYHATS